MKGVLLKDLYIAKSNILVTVVSLVVLGFGLSFLLETSALLVLAPVASTTAVFISITSDAASKWNKNVITMPVSRGLLPSLPCACMGRLASAPRCWPAASASLAPTCLTRRNLKSCL